MTTASSYTKQAETFRASIERRVRQRLGAAASESTVRRRVDSEVERLALRLASRMAGDTSSQRWDAERGDS